MRADEVAASLGARRCGRGWIATCPGHDDHVPSLSIRESDNGKVLIHCHAGCEQRRVIDALRSRGLWEYTGLREVTRTASLIGFGGRSGPDDAMRSEAALAIWQSAIPARGTPVETYLASRALYLPQSARLRFHAGLKHPSGGVWPAMVALVTRVSDGTPSAISRTFLARDGNGKAPVEPARLMFGPCRGGVVQLGAVLHELLVGEGIETVLAAMQATGISGWAALSTSGLRALDVPANAREVTIIADGDHAGEAAAQHAARRWADQGRRVRIARPPWGMDFNDLLRAGT